MLIQRRREGREEGWERRGPTCKARWRAGRKGERRVSPKPKTKLRPWTWIVDNGRDTEVELVKVHPLQSIRATGEQPVVHSRYKMLV